jgi:hypothetical protein
MESGIRSKNKAKKVIASAVTVAIALTMLLPICLTWAGVKTLTDNPGEFNIFTSKIAPVAGDILAIEDSTSTPLWIKKKITFGSLDSLYVPKSLYDAHSVLVANLDNTPYKLTLTEETVLGRVTGANIAPLDLGVIPGNVMKAPIDPGAHTIFGFDNSANIYKNFQIGTGLSYDPLTGIFSSTATGVTAHSALTELAYGDSDHTGFQIASFVNVKEYGAIGDGVADDTTAIQAACDVGKDVYFPAGTYKVSSTITLSIAGRYYGDGRLSTIIRTTSATADTFNITANGVHISGMYFDCTTTRTGGYYINSTGIAGYCSIRDFYMDAPYYGIHCAWTRGEIDGGTITNLVADNGIGILIDNYGGATINNVTIIGDSNNQAYAGIMLTHSIQIFISQCSVIYCGRGLYFSATTQVIDSSYITDCVFDSNEYNIYVYSGASGKTVTNTNLVNLVVFTSTVGAGITTYTANSGMIANISITNCDVFHNYGHGINISAGTHDTKIANCNINNNGLTTGSGIFLANEVVDYSIVGNKIGSSAFANGNTRYGIEFGGSNSKGVVIGNYELGNTLGARSGAPTTNFVNIGNLTATSGTTFGIPISAANKILGRKTSGAGDAEELSGTDVKGIMSVTVSEVSASRALDTEYTNSTGVPMDVTISPSNGSADCGFKVYIGSSSASTEVAAANTPRYYLIPITFKVPAGWKYKCTASAAGGSIYKWVESY